MIEIINLMILSTTYTIGYMIVIAFLIFVTSLIVYATFFFIERAGWKFSVLYGLTKIELRISKEEKEVITEIYKKYLK